MSKDIEFIENAKDIGFIEGVLIGVEMLMPDINHDAIVKAKECAARIQKRNLDAVVAVINAGTTIRSKPTSIKETLEPTAAEIGVPIDSPKEAPNATNNTKLTALSPGALAIGRTLINPFSATDLMARLDGDKGRSYSWIAAWKGKGWIETVSFGIYKRLDTFPQS